MNKQTFGKRPNPIEIKAPIIVGETDKQRDARIALEWQGLIASRDVPSLKAAR